MFLGSWPPTLSARWPTSAASRGGASDASALYWFLYLPWWWCSRLYSDAIFRQQISPRPCGGRGPIPGTARGAHLRVFIAAAHHPGGRFPGHVAILPWLVRPLVGTSEMLVTSTGLLIVVGVALDTMKQIEAQLLMRHYEGFIKKLR